MSVLPLSLKHSLHWLFRYPLTMQWLASVLLEVTYSGVYELALLIRYPMYSSLVENEEGRCISGVFSMNGNMPEQVNAHATTLW